LKKFVFRAQLTRSFLYVPFCLYPHTVFYLKLETLETVKAVNDSVRDTQRTEFDIDMRKDKGADRSDKKTRKKA